MGQWNGIAKPLILWTPCLSRNSRWLWYHNATVSEESGTPTLVAADPHHPIFKGLSLRGTGPFFHSGCCRPRGTVHGRRARSRTEQRLFRTERPIISLIFRRRLW
jgi:hypothetical protein